MYNVNNYDFFRNPTQAKDLLIQALGIQPASESIFDGKLDGSKVKIMPANRIATKADVDELLNKLPYYKYEKLSANNPSENVEDILLICMGHEPDIKAHMKQALNKYKIEVDVLDILRDKSDLQLKRDAETNIIIEKGKLIIKEFYPMNLLQKLSLQKESVEEWRQLVDSIMVDWNYDGVIMQPSICDIPEKDVVKGEYTIPDNAGRIKVKITDILSESLEIEVTNG